MSTSHDRRMDALWAVAFNEEYKKELSLGIDFPVAADRAVAAAEDTVNAAERAVGRYTRNRIKERDEKIKKLRDEYRVGYTFDYGGRWMLVQSVSIGGIQCIDQWGHNIFHRWENLP